MSKNDKAAVLLLNTLFILVSSYEMRDIKYQIMSVLRAGYNFVLIKEEVDFFREKSKEVYESLEKDLTHSEVVCLVLFFSLLYLEHVKGIRAYLWGQLTSIVHEYGNSEPTKKVLNSIDIIQKEMEKIRG